MFCLLNQRVAAIERNTTNVRLSESPRKRPAWEGGVADGRFGGGRAPRFHGGLATLQNHISRLVKSAGPTIGPAVSGVGGEQL